MTNKDIDLSVSNLHATRGKSYDIALLPWGATEPHNLHLPYLTDAILSHDVAVDAAAIARDRSGIRSMVLPAMPLGSQNPGQREENFCIHYRQQTQESVLRDIVSSLRYQGIPRLLIVNGHGGNSFKGFIRDLAVDYPDMLVGTCEWFKAADAKAYFEAPGDHADELETSVMMHYHPELVDLTEAGAGAANGFSGIAMRKGTGWVPRNWQKGSTDTGIGDPRTATAEKGRLFAAACADNLAMLLSDLCADDMYTHDR
ncbi:MAG: creatininase family protein [Muribaculaceae bacterium]|nr:creatininase family protein [Muribaculaceae bacterium]